MVPAAAKPSIVDRTASALLLLTLGCGGGAKPEPVTTLEVDESAHPSLPERSPEPEPREADPAGTYMGRELATTMSHLGAPWLTRSNRDDEEDATAMHQQLAGC